MLKCITSYSHIGTFNIYFVNKPFNLKDHIYNELIKLLFVQVQAIFIWSFCYYIL